MIEKSHIEEFIRQAKRVIEAGLTQCSSGNLSCRVGSQMLVSATSTWLGELKPEQVAILDIETGKNLNGVRASIESAFHLGVLRERNEMNVVLHCQSPYATTVACLKEKPTNFNVTLEIPLYVGAEIPIIPFHQPGSADLAEAVIASMREHNSVILSNHGQVVCGKNYADAIQRATFLEMACRIIIQSGGNYSVLNSSEIDYLQHLQR